MLARVLLSLVICTLLACGGNSRAPVEDRIARSQSSFHRGSTSAYLVQRGDTLYSIAFRYGLDYRKVAAANSIPAPYTIYPGQQVYLHEAPSPAPTVLPPAQSAAGTIATPRPIPTTTPIPLPKPGLTKPAVAVAAPAPAPVATPVPAVVPAPAPPVPKPVAAPTYTGGKVSVWRWPTTGSVTRGYSGSVHKGIDIGGNRGDSVVAVADGKIVYAGAGIVGFGELLIVKHNEVYLSAYGHNDELLVSEGEVVRAGQTIARKGSSGTDTVKLHFEIRKEGKPIDPQRLLPRR